MKLSTPAIPGPPTAPPHRLTGGRHVRPRQTIAQAPEPSGAGTCSSVSARASGIAPGVRRCGAIRITVLLTAKRATAVASSRTASDPEPTTTTWTGSRSSRSSAKSVAACVEAEVLDDAREAAQRIFGDLAILLLSAERFKPKQRRGCGGIAGRCGRVLQRLAPRPERSQRNLSVEVCRRHRKTRPPCAS